MNKNPGLKIRQLRELKGFSQDYMARQLNISQRAYSKMERNETKVDWTKISAIAKLFDMDSIDLVQFDDNTVFSKDFPIKNRPINQEKLIEQFEKHIKWLQDEILFLREQLARKLK